MAGHSKWANIKHKKEKPMLKEERYLRRWKGNRDSCEARRADQKPTQS